LQAEISLQRSGILSIRMGREGDLGDGPSALGHRGIRTASLFPVVSAWASARWGGTPFRTLG